MVFTTTRKSVRSYSVYKAGRKRTYKETFKRCKKELQDGLSSSFLTTEVTSQPSMQTDGPSRNDTTSNDQHNSKNDTKYTFAKQSRIEEWASIRDVLLNVGIATCAPATDDIKCDKCSKEEMVYHCLDCHQWNVFCHDCLMSRHQYPHLHMFEAWKNGCFVGYSSETPAWTLSHKCETLYFKDLVIVDDKGNVELNKKKGYFA